MTSKARGSEIQRCNWWRESIRWPRGKLNSKYSRIFVTCKKVWIFVTNYVHVWCPSYAWLAYLAIKLSTYIPLENCSDLNLRRPEFASVHQVKQTVFKAIPTTQHAKNWTSVSSCIPDWQSYDSGVSWNYYSCREYVRITGMQFKKWKRHNANCASSKHEPRTFVAVCNVMPGMTYRIMLHSTPKFGFNTFDNSIWRDIMLGAISWGKEQSLYSCTLWTVAHLIFPSSVV